MNKILDLINDGKISCALDKLTGLLDSSPEYGHIRLAKRVIQACVSYLENQAVHASQHELNDVHEVIAICHGFERKQIDATATHPDSTLVQPLYYALQHSLKLDYKWALSVSPLLKNDLRKIFTVRKGMDDHKIELTVATNCYLLLWNTAMKCQNNKSIEVSDQLLETFKLRLEALSYLAFSEDISKLCEQASRAVYAFESQLQDGCRSDYIKYFNDMWDLVNSAIETSTIRDSEFKTLTWVSCISIATSHVMYYLKCGAASKVPLFIDKLKGLVESDANIFTTKGRQWCLWNLKIMSAAAYVSKLTSSNAKHELVLKELCSLLTSCSDQLDEVKKVASNVNQALSVTQYVLYMFEHQIRKYLGASKRKILIFEPNCVLVIIQLLKIRTHLLIGIVDAVTCTVKFPDISSVCLIFQLLDSLIESLPKESETSEEGDNIFSEAKASTTLCCDLLNELKTVNHPEYCKFTSAIGNMIGKIATSYYNKGWLSSAVFFLEKYTALILFETFDSDETNMCLTEKQVEALRLLDALIVCLPRLNRFQEALELIARRYILNPRRLEECIELACKVKKHAFRTMKFSVSEKLITLSELVEKFSCDKSSLDIFSITIAELQSNSERLHDTSKECQFLIKRLLEMSLSKERRALVLIAQIQLQWAKVITLSMSAQSNCREAIALLKELVSQQPNSPNLCCSLATAYFWQYLIELQVNQETLEIELSKTPVVPLEVNTKDDVNDEDDDNFDTVPITPAYQHNTISQEYAALTALDASLKIWSSVVQENVHLIHNKSQVLNTLKSIAQAYAVMRHASNEALAWKLAIQLSEVMNNYKECGFCMAQLILLLTQSGHLNLAREVVGKSRSLYAKLNPDTDERVSQICLLTAESELLLAEGQVLSGWRLLCKALGHPMHQLNSWWAKLLTAQLKLLASKYTLLPSSDFPRESPVDESPLDMALHSFRCAVSFFGLVNSERLDFKTHGLLSTPFFRFKGTTILLDCAFHIGKLYCDLGMPQQAKCYLKEQLLCCQRLALASRTVELLLCLANIDVMCNQLDDCIVKLNGVHYILHSSESSVCRSAIVIAPSQSVSSCIAHETSNDEHLEDEEKFKIAEPLDNTRTLGSGSSSDSSGPSFLNSRLYKVPKLMMHDTKCTCIYCSNGMLRRLCLEFVMTSSLLLREKQEFVAAESLLLKALSIYKKFASEIQCCHTVNSINLGDISVGATMFQSNIPTFKTELCLAHIMCELSIVQFEMGCLSSSLTNAEGVIKILNRIPLHGDYTKHLLEARTKYYLGRLMIILLAEKCGHSVNELFHEIWSTSSLPSNTDEENNLAENLFKLCLNENSTDNDPEAAVSQPQFVVEDVLPSGLISSKANFSAKAGQVSALDFQKTPMFNHNSAHNQRNTRAQHKACQAPLKKATKSKYCHLFSSDSESDDQVKCSTVESSTTTVKKNLPAKKDESCDKEFEINSLDSAVSKGIDKKQSPTYNIMKPKNNNDSDLEIIENHYLKNCTPQTVATRHLHASMKKYSAISKSTNDEEKRKKSTIKSTRSRTHRKVTSRSLVDKCNAQSARVTRSHTVNKENESDDDIPVPCRRLHLATATVHPCPSYEDHPNGKKDKSEYDLNGTKSNNSNGKGYKIRKFPLFEDTESPRHEHASPKTCAVVLLKNSHCSPERIRADSLTSDEEICNCSDVSKRTYTRQGSTHGAATQRRRRQGALSVERTTDMSAAPLLSNRIRNIHGNVEKSFLPTQGTNLISPPTTTSSPRKSNAPIKVWDDTENPTFIKITQILQEGLKLVMRCPPVPLYSNLCLLLSLCLGNKHKETAYYLNESFHVAVRHEALVVLSKSIRNAKENSKSGASDIINTTDMSVYSHFKKRRDIFMFGETRIDTLQEFIRIIPKGWTICQIKISPVISPSNRQRGNPDLIVCRYRHGEDPLLVKISNISSSCTGTVDFITEFKKIMDESQQSLKLTNKKAWWECRRSLDQRLKVLLDSIESKWLGCWRGLLLGSPADVADQNRLDESTCKLMKQCQEKGLKLSKQLLQVLLDTHVWLSNEQLFYGVSQLLGLPLMNLKVREFSRLIRQEGRAMGNVLIPRQNTVLILDKCLQMLPWECLPLLRDNPITRMPSLHLLFGHLDGLYENQYKIHQGIDTTQAFYVLNPGNNLPNTEIMFKGIFERYKWKGVIGKSPSQEECFNAITKHDLYIYCGHGSGSKYFGSGTIQHLKGRASALLMGCSTGRFRDEIKMASYSPIVPYLLAECPCVVGNLWDVTDGDIDRFLKDLLKRWLPSEEQEREIAIAMTKARSACVLPLLVGASPVIYGLPINACI